MEYRTFTESNTHNRRSTEHLVNLLRNRVDAAPSFALLLGAGASVTSGIRAASSMLEEWRRTRYAASSDAEPYEEWLHQQDWFEAEDEYSQLFELTYDQPSQRRSFIENAVARGRPSWGYAYLTSLIEARVINAIFTTNFDDLINEACFQFGGRLRPLVCAHDSSVSSIRLMSERPKVIKLHGDFLYDSIKNTTSELSNLEQNMRDKLTEFSREFGLLVVGYSGSDKSVMDALSGLARSPMSFRNGVYWCVRRGVTPGPRLRQFLRNERVYWVEIDGYDELMADVANGLSLSLPSGVAAPHEAAIARNQHLFDEENSTTHPKILQARGACGETYRRVCETLHANGLRSSTKMRATKTDEAVDDLAEFTVPLLQGSLASDAKDFAKAEGIFRGLLVKVPAERAWAVFRRLLDCLLDAGSRGEDIRNLLKSEIPKHGDSDDFAKSAYYALFVNESDLAMDFAAKALSLNPGSSVALVNKGLSHLQKDQLTEVRTIADSLVAPRMSERYRAAGYGMIGDAQSMIVPLQRAIALKEYSPEEALRDVAFRPYWEHRGFLDALRPFVKGSAELVPPRLAHYPMSEPEQALAKTTRGKLSVVVSSYLLEGICSRRPVSRGSPEAVGRGLTSRRAARAR